MIVFFLIDRLEGGGTEKSTLDLAYELARQGHEVSVCALNRGLETPMLAGKVRFYEIRSENFLGQVREVCGLLKSVRPEVVHTALYKSDQVGRMAGVLCRVPVVSSLVGTPYARERLVEARLVPWRLHGRQLIDAITGRLFVSRFHAVSEGTAEANRQALRIPAERLVVAERGRDPKEVGTNSDERRGAIRDRLGIDPETNVILAVGRQDYAKGFVYLVRAIASLSMSHPDCILLIAGPKGNATDSLAEAVCLAGKQGARIELLGPRDDVPDLICGADVFVLSSLYEGFPGVVFEAMCIGIPIVASDLPGLRGILVAGQNAMLSIPGDPDDLCGKIASVLASPELAARMAAKGREQFVDHFTLNAAAMRMALLYADVIA